jgi:hypothetical protein
VGHGDDFFRRPALRRNQFGVEGAKNVLFVTEVGESVIGDDNSGLGHVIGKAVRPEKIPGHETAPRA